MGLWPFGRKATEDKNVDRLLEEANAASPTAVPPPVAAPGGAFTMPVEDVFMITGRGVVVTGRVATGVVTLDQPVTVVRNGAVVASTKIKGIEMFRAVKETATVGDNVGLLLDAIQRDQLMSGDLIQG
jgi:translation elongation factor EF-Tu-like GTPase